MREQKEEEERIAVDIEEAKFQAAQRKEAIDKAKTQQYYQTDRVKGFHVSEGLSSKCFFAVTLICYICRTLYLKSNS